MGAVSNGDTTPTKASNRNAKRMVKSVAGGKDEKEVDSAHSRPARGENQSAAANRPPCLYRSSSYVGGEAKLVWEAVVIWNLRPSSIQPTVPRGVGASVRLAGHTLTFNKRRVGCLHKRKFCMRCSTDWLRWMLQRSTLCASAHAGLSPSAHRSGPLSSSSPPWRERLRDSACKSSERIQF